MGCNLSASPQGRVTTGQAMVAQKPLRGLEHRDLTDALRDREAMLFAQTLVTITDENFSFEVMQALRSITAAKAPQPRRRSTEAPQSSGASGSKTFRSRMGTKNSAMYKKLSFQTHYSMYEVDQLFQEFSDIVSDEPFSEKHMRMFFAQQGIGSKLIDLIIDSLGYATEVAAAVPTESSDADKDRQLKACCACVQTLSILKKGTNEEKLYFYCRLFDINSDGVLEPDELHTFSDVMYDSYRAHRQLDSGGGGGPSGPSGASTVEDDRAKQAIDLLLGEIVDELAKTPEGGIRLEDVLGHHKLLKLWELLKVT
ncbi:hypothetical protein Pelo_3758 [Pelomyxa schiedti]|nr:hypothetical protein Pelo_3758 [Pelomyxa schiedti]